MKCFSTIHIRTGTYWRRIRLPPLACCLDEQHDFTVAVAGPQVLADAILAVGNLLDEFYIAGGRDPVQNIPGVPFNVTGSVSLTH